MMFHGMSYYYLGVTSYKSYNVECDVVQIGNVDHQQEDVRRLKVFEMWVLRSWIGVLEC